MADVFVSYSRRDQAFVRRLHEALVAAGRETWVDWEGIPPSAKWMDEVRAAIDAAGAFVFVVSPDSAGSPVCREEAEHAALEGKRILPVVWRDTPPDDLPEAVRAHNWLLLRETDDFDTGVARLLETLDTDPEWVHAHTRLVTRSREWEDSGRDRSRLLRGRDLEAAELALVGSAGRDPRPTPLQAAYVAASRRAQRRGQRIRTGLLAAGLVAALGLAGFALLQRSEAQTNALLAQQHQAEAEANQTLAEANQAEAEANADLAFGRELAHAALERLDTDPELSILLALEGVGVSRTEETDQALRRAVQGSPLRALHRNDIGRIAIARIAPDARHALAGGFGGTVWAIDPLGATPPVRLGAATRGIESLAISDDGSLALATSGDGHVLAWDTTGAAPPLDVPVDAGGAYTVSVDPQRRWFIAGGVDGRMAAYDLRTGELLASFQSGEVDDVASAVSPDGTRVAVAGYDLAVREWSTADWSLLRTYKGATDLVVTLAYTADSRRLAAGGQDRVVRIWDVTTGEQVAELVGHRGVVSQVRFAPDGLSAVTAAADGSARLWDAVTGETLTVYPGQRAAVMAAVTTADEVVTLASDGAVRHFARRADGPTATGVGHGQLIPTVRWSPDGTQLVSASLDRTGRLWVGPTLEVGPVLNGHTEGVLSAAFVPDGSAVVTASVDGSVRRWDAGAGGAGTVIVEGLPPLGDVVISPDGKDAIVAAEDGIHRIDLSTGADAKVPEAGTTSAVSSAGDVFTAVSADGAVTVYEVDGTRLLELAHPSDVLDAQLDPTGRWVASAAEDGLVHVQDARTGGERIVLAPTSVGGFATAVAWSPDGSQIVAGFDDGALRVWDVESGEELATFAVDRSAILDVAFAGNGRIAATVEKSIVLDVFSCDVCGSTDDVIALARTRVTRELTPDERVRFLHESGAAPSSSAKPEASAGPTAGASSPASASPDPSATPDVDELGVNLCPGDVTCLIQAGRVHPRDFDLPLTLEVGDGWVSTRSFESAFEVGPAAGGAAVSVATGLDGVRGNEVVPIGPGAAALEAHIRGTPGLAVTPGEAVTVDGRPATRFDVECTCAAGLVPVWQSGPTRWATAFGEHDRMIVLDVGDRTLLITIWAPTREAFDAGIAEAERVLSTLDLDPAP